MIGIEFREDLPFVLNRLGLVGAGVEVGVQRGEFSAHLLRYWEGRKLYLVDAWRQIPGYDDIANVDPNGQLDAMARAFMAVYPHERRATLIRDFSVEASMLFPDEVLDFVYLDANHSHEGVRADLAAWAPKVRKGGIVCGHDYLDSPRVENGLADFGVKRAVNEWAGGARIHVTTRDPFPSWFVTR